MRNVLKISALGLVSALTPLSLMAESSAAGNACSSGFYAGLQLEAKTTMNKVKMASAVAPTGSMHAEKIVFQPLTQEKKDELKALDVTVNVEGTQDVGFLNDKEKTLYIVSGTEGSTPSASSVSKIVNRLAAGNFDKVVVLQPTGSTAPTLGEITKLLSVPAAETKAPSAEDAKVSLNVNPTYLGGGLLVGYQYSFGSGFSVAPELGVGWVAGKGRFLNTKDKTQDAEFSIKGGYYVRGLVWGRYALTPQSAVALGLGVTQSQQKGKPTGSTDDKSNFNVNSTHFCVAGELSAAPSSAQNVVLFTRAVYDFKTNKKDISRKNGDNKDKIATGYSVEAQGLSLSFGVRYVF